ncbi:MAG TPA: DinB family protein [Vicinamibacterales bacterium]|nr:DinB family protein [Vicinamibacterales bacterium]
MTQVAASTDRTRRPFVMEDAITILSRTPAVLNALLRGLPAGWIQAHEGGETWSAYDVVGHLVHGERTNWMARLRIILEHGESRAFDPFDRFAQFAEPAGRTLEDLLDEFADRRSANVRDLKALDLSEADLDRKGLHPSIGPVTLRNLLATWVAHDMDHLMQVSRVLGRQYSDEVGPWRAYLRVISGQQG